MLAHTLRFAVLATALAACTSSTELGALQDRKLAISGGPGNVTMWLDYAGSDCITLDSSVEATLDGQPFELSESGGWEDYPDGGGHCQSPELTIDNTPSGPATIHIAEGSTAIDVTLPDLIEDRSIALPPNTTLHNASSVELVPSMPATDTLVEFEMIAACPSWGPVFDATGSGTELTLPDEDSVVSECDPSLAPLALSFTFTLFTNPQITECSGATCTAAASATTTTTATFAP
jgi:hypothetical protein